MKRINKRLLIFISVIAMLFGEGFIMTVNAEWEKEDSNWKFISDYGYETGWQQINGKWYYFTPETAIMKIGWFYDKEYGKWYYLNFEGDMDASRTTSTYPFELSNIQNKIKQYTNEDTLYNTSSKIDGNTFVCFKNEISCRQYYYHPLTGNVYEFKNGILTNIATKEVFNIFTKEQAVQLIRDYLLKNNKYIPQKINVENDNGDSYLVHCYDDMESYTVTSSWYYINKTTRKITSAL